MLVMLIANNNCWTSELDRIALVVSIQFTLSLWLCSRWYYVSYSLSMRLHLLRWGKKSSIFLFLYLFLNVFWWCHLLTGMLQCCVWLFLYFRAVRSWQLPAWADLAVPRPLRSLSWSWKVTVLYFRFPRPMTSTNVFEQVNCKSLSKMTS